MPCVCEERLAKAEMQHREQQARTPTHAHAHTHTSARTLARARAHTHTHMHARAQARNPLEPLLVKLAREFSDSQDLSDRLQKLYQVRDGEGGRQK